jgi:hypothetical protein
VFRVNGGDEEVEVTVVVDDAHLATTSQVAERLEMVGLVVDEVSSQTGTIAGRIEASRVPTLSEVPGVLRVESARRFQVPPPDSQPQ